MSSMIQVRVDRDLFEAAKSAGAVVRRSAAEQIRHWARIGREFENAARVEATEKTQRADRMKAFAQLRELDEALEEPEYVETDPSIREITRRLNAALGETLVAALAYSDDPKASHGWATEDGLLPPRGSITRLAFAYEQWQKIAAAEGEQVARLWFVGANPRLDNDTPANAIREGLLEEVGEAARALVDDSFAG
ncbi:MULTISPECIES: TA system antitoxin ParD family protein [unclassified Cryobacterium]|uniref:TA system antitoxin ParD family protein n=1 Tax=unclassified Cryobacterium TaxID=2649013 RepID=UPI002AB53212|nr:MULTISPECIES: hypothetical protein [unclassified Cryobacterium]MDY7541788.1 hypothetical protein [Cryobacterium sp. 5B3]MEB0266788.1 hypothetical protein [Cryobacterium sp. 10I5]MEB0275232.1 hypothetical protein [Cryobacterium sp. 5B3]